MCYLSWLQTPSSSELLSLESVVEHFLFYYYYYYYCYLFYSLLPKTVYERTLTTAALVLPLHVNVEFCSACHTTKSNYL